MAIDPGKLTQPASEIGISGAVDFQHLPAC